MKEKKWYEYLIWNEMRTTWKRLPKHIKQEIIDSGVEVPEDLKRDL